jgi:hypothetical protein
VGLKVVAPLLYSPAPTLYLTVVLVLLLPLFSLSSTVNWTIVVNIPIDNETNIALVGVCISSIVHVRVGVGVGVVVDDRILWHFRCGFFLVCAIINISLSD